jgi:hypothetical protein
VVGVVGPVASAASLRGHGVAERKSQWARNTGACSATNSCHWQGTRGLGHLRWPVQTNTAADSDASVILVAADKASTAIAATGKRGTGPCGGSLQQRCQGHLSRPWRRPGQSAA